MRRLAVASLLLALALLAGACEGGTQAASVAPSGTRATAGESDGSDQRLSIVDVSSGTGTAFTAPPGATEFDVTLDGLMVAYSDLDEKGNAQVFVMDADGSNARQLTHDEGEGDRGPSWSPDGSMIAYERDTSNDPQIFVVRVSNGVSTQVTTEPRGAVDPGGWAPDGRSLIFSTINTAGHQYTARSLDLTTEQSRLIVADGSTPTLSPDGAWIAFNSWLKEPQVRLILAKSDGSKRRIIARFDNDEGYQRWSPNSTQIAFIDYSGEDGSGTYVYDLATGQARFVTAGTIESWIDDDHILVS
jgi:Tol biopolymer transport system component